MGIRPGPETNIFSISKKISGIPPEIPVDKAEKDFLRALRWREMCGRPHGNPSRRKGKKMKSFIAKPAEVERKWYVIDAEGKTLGRLASEVASILRGKKKPIYTPHVDCGDYVIVINAEKVEVTGKKRKEKIYKRHTGYPGGLREITFEKLQAKKPDEIIRHAVKGMLPDGKLGRQMYKKLKVYAGAEHPHTAQQPETWEF